jgi:antitoxin VapB
MCKLENMTLVLYILFQKQDIPMTIYIKDPVTDSIVRKLAKKRGVSITEAIRRAAEKDLASDKDKLSLHERLQPLLDRIDKVPRTGLKADKAFYDWLSGEEG